MTANGYNKNKSLCFNVEIYHFFKTTADDDCQKYKWLHYSKYQFSMLCFKTEFYNELAQNLLLDIIFKLNWPISTQLEEEIPYPMIILLYLQRTSNLLVIQHFQHIPFPFQHIPLYMITNFTLSTNMWVTVMANSLSHYTNQNHNAGKTIQNLCRWAKLSTSSYKIY